MKIFLSGCILLFFQSLAVVAQVSDSVFLPIVQDHQWGFINANGDIVISPRYQQVGSFNESGLAFGKLNDKYGAISRKGDVILPFAYEGVLPLTRDYLSVKKEGSWGVVDLDGNEIIPCLYRSVEVLGFGFFKVLDKKGRGVLNHRAEEILPSIYGEIIITSDTNFIVNKNETSPHKGLFDKNGKMVFDFIFLSFRSTEYGKLAMSDSIDFQYYNSVLNKKETSVWNTQSEVTKDIWWVKKGTERVLFNHQKSLYADIGNIIQVNPIDDSLMIVVTDSGFGKTGVVHQNGKTILDPIYDDISLFDSTYIAVLKDNHWGLSTKDGFVFLKPSYVNFIPMVGKYFKTKNEDDLYGFASFDKGEIEPSIYSKIIFEGDKIKCFHEDYAKIYKLKNGVLEDPLIFKKYNSVSIVENEFEEDQFWSMWLPANLPQTNSNPSDRNSDSWNVDGDHNGMRVYQDIKTKKYGLAITVSRDDNPDCGRDCKKITDAFLDGIRITDFENKDFALGWVGPSKSGYGNYYIMFRDGRIISNYKYTDSAGKEYVSRITTVNDFHDGLAAINLGGKPIGAFPNLRSSKSGVWGYIDENAEMKISPQYLKADDFENGKAIVASKKGVGMIAVSGEEIIPVVFQDVKPIEGTQKTLYKTVMQKMNYGFINQEGDPITDLDFRKVESFQDRIAAVRKHFEYTFVDDKGVEFGVEGVQRTPGFGNGALVAVRLENKWGWMNKQGEVVIEPQFDEAGSFYDGLAFFKTEGKYGFLNEESDTVIKPKFSKAYDFNNGVAIAKRGGKYGLINEKGWFVLNPTFYKIHSFRNDGFALAQSKNKLSYVLISSDAKIINKKRLGATISYRRIYEFEMGLAKVKKRNRWGFIDTLGNEMIATNYKDALIASDSVVAVKKGKKWGYVLLNGETLIDFEYWKATNFVNGVAVVLNADFIWEIIHKDGSKIELFKCHSISDFSNGLAIVKINRDREQYYYINESGKDVFQKTFLEAQPFDESGLAVVKTSDGFGLIDKNGNEVIPCHYTEIADAKEGMRTAMMEKSYGVYTTTGQQIANPSYEIIEAVNEDILKLWKGGKVGYLHKNGTWIWEPTK